MMAPDDLWKTGVLVMITGGLAGVVVTIIGFVMDWIDRRNGR